MTTAVQITQWFGSLIPVASFIAVAISVILFAKNKGTMDAQDKAIETWQNLAESYAATIEELTRKLEACEKEIHELRTELEISKKAMDAAVAAFKRATP